MFASSMFALLVKSLTAFLAIEIDLWLARGPAAHRTFNRQFGIPFHVQGHTNALEEGNVLTELAFTDLWYSTPPQKKSLKVITTGFSNLGWLLSAAEMKIFKQFDQQATTAGFDMRVYHRGVCGQNKQEVGGILICRECNHSLPPPWLPPQLHLYIHIKARRKNTCTDTLHGCSILHVSSLSWTRPRAVYRPWITSLPVGSLTGMLACCLSDWMSVVGWSGIFFLASNYNLAFSVTLCIRLHRWMSI